MNPVEIIDEQIMFYYSTHGKKPDSITMGYDFYSEFIVHILKTSRIYDSQVHRSEYKGIPVYRTTIVSGKGSDNFVLGEIV